MTDNLCLLLENDQAELLDPELCETPEERAAVEAQIYELKRFKAHKLPSGLVRYAAPANEHDDMAIALMAAALLVREQSGDWVQAVEALGPLW
jgi:hypothetical protein